MGTRKPEEDSLVMPTVVAVVMGAAVITTFAYTPTGWFLGLLVTYIAFRAVRGWGDGRFDDGYTAGVSAAAETIEEED